MDDRTKDQTPEPPRLIETTPPMPLSNRQTLASAPETEAPKDKIYSDWASI